MNSINRISIADGVYFNTVRDSRFKTMKLAANLIVPLRKDTAAPNALLVGVLSRSCKAYPDFTVLSKKLSALYGAELSVSVHKVGDRQVINIAVSGLDDRYALYGESIARELSELLCQVIFEPRLDEQAFVDEEVEQERRQLLDVIDSEFNEKRIYANSQLISHMCENEVYGIKRYGSAEAIKAVTAADLYTTWQNLLSTAVFEMMYIGDSDPQQAIEVFRDVFAKIRRMPAEITNTVVPDAASVRRITETMEVSQSKLVMGFRTGCAVPDSKVPAMQLMSAVLGGTANSKLFCNVREKQSLCYYCASRHDKYKGILIIDSGVEGANVEKAEQGILKELEDMKNGVISDFELESAKLALINSYYSSNDTVSGIEAWYSSQLFEDGFRSIAESAAAIQAVTKQDVIDAANAVTLDTVYVLKNQ